MLKSYPRRSFLGVGLILAGLLLLLGQLHYLTVGWATVLWGALAVLGLYRIILGFTLAGKGMWFGSMLLGIGGYNVLLAMRVAFIPSYLMLPAIIILAGAGILLGYIAAPRRWHLLVPALLLMGLGTVMAMAEEGYFSRWDVIDTIQMWWPAALILFGAALLLDKDRPSLK